MANDPQLYQQLGEIIGTQKAIQASIAAIGDDTKGMSGRIKSLEDGALVSKTKVSTLAFLGGGIGAFVMTNFHKITEIFKS